MTVGAIALPRPRLARIRARSWRSKLAVASLAIVLTLCAGEFAAAWRGSDWAMYPPPVPVPYGLADYPALARASTPMTFHTSTGVTLVGRFIRGRMGATVILSHGGGGTQDEMLPLASTLHNAGFNVVTYSERGRGGSTGQITLGTLETKDLRSIVGAVSRHRYVDATKIGAFGFSMGAGFTLLEAANDRRVKAVVDDAGWANAFDWLDPKFSDLWKNPTHMYGPLALKLLELRTGVDLTTLRPEKVIAKISPRPLLIIQGTKDHIVAPIEAERNYAAARAPKTLWLLKGADHYGPVHPGGAATSPRVAAFFMHALLGRSL